MNVQHEPIDQSSGLILFCMLSTLMASSTGCQPSLSKKVTVTTGENQRVATDVSSVITPAAANFNDRSIAAFLNCKFSNGKESDLRSILEIVGGGVGCMDYDNDGNADLFFPRGGRIDAEKQQVFGINSALLRGSDSWGFEDVSILAGVDTRRIYSHGISSVDFDNDGFDDLLIYGYGGAILLHNLGEGTFCVATLNASSSPIKWPTTATWIDVNQDQSLDLYLGSYVDWDFEKHQVCRAKGGQPDVCSPNAFDGAKNGVYINNSDGTFSQNDEWLQTDQPAKSLGCLSAEFHSGQGVGLYVANDLVPNFLFTRKNGRFEEQGFSAGAAVDESGVANGSMGVILFDFNLDRKFDLFVTNFDHEMMALYLGADGDLFVHQSRKMGLNRADLQVVGFGVVAGDFDADADEDIVFTAGHVHYHPDTGAMEQIPIYLQNEAGKSFAKTTPDCNFFKNGQVGRGLTTADLDNDGDLDIVGTSLFSAPTAIENVSQSSYRWLTLNLIGVECPRTPIGAIAEVKAGGKSMIRQLYGGGSYLSQIQHRLHFAWPAHQSPSSTVDVTIRWPGQTVPQSLNIQVDQHIAIKQQ